MIVVLRRIDPSTLSAIELARPLMRAPEWSWVAMVELVFPLAITVLVVQNGQGFAVLKAPGHEPPSTRSRSHAASAQSPARPSAASAPV